MNKQQLANKIWASANKMRSQCPSAWYGAADSLRDDPAGLRGRIETGF